MVSGSSSSSATETGQSASSPSAWAGLAAKGEVIGAHDLWIAATAMAHGLDLATDDGQSFSRIPGLTVLSGP